MLKVIAVEIPFLISFLPKQPVNAIVTDNYEIYIYSKFQELVSIGSYMSYIETICHRVKEGKYEWVDFTIEEGDCIHKDYGNNIMINNEPIICFLNNGGKKKISDKFLKLFNNFLKKVNKQNKDMTNALEIALNDGFFREQVEEIISDDEVNELSNLDKEIIVRLKIEGSRFIEKYVETTLEIENPERFMNINYFFRRIFNLEVNTYLE